MFPILDYHMHTPLCGHAKGLPEEYATHAIKIGLEEIGFSDHSPLVARQIPDVAMDFKELTQYYSMIEKAQNVFKNELNIKIGIEADYIPGYEDQIKTIISDYPYDYVIGSIHFINDWAFDNPFERHLWEQKNVNEVYQNYYKLLRQSAQSQLYDIMGHVDLVKKFGHRASQDLKDEIINTAQVFKETGMVIEINTAGLRKTVKEIYPHIEDLKIYCQAGVPITFGSDAHTPKEVGYKFREARELALTAGYSEYVSFTQRKIAKIKKL